MEAAHRDYLLGSLYFMANDPAVNNYTRYAIGRWGMCNDEYVAAGNFPPQIYVRISNRLRGVALLTQNNINHPQARADSVAVGNWEFDRAFTAHPLTPARCTRNCDPNKPPPTRPRAPTTINQQSTRSRGASCAMRATRAASSSSTRATCGSPSALEIGMTCPLA